MLGLSLLPAADRRTVSLPGSCVSFGPLASDRKSPSVPQTFVTAEIHLILDVEGDLPAEVSFHHMVLND